MNLISKPRQNERIIFNADNSKDMPVLIKLTKLKLAFLLLISGHKPLL